MAIESFSDFEKIVGMSFAQSGFNITEPSPNQPGYDLIATEGERVIAIQVKNYKNNIPINVVTKFRDFMLNSDFPEGILVSAKGFSKPALTSVRAEKPNDFYLAHYDDNKGEVVWDYRPDVITDPPPPPPISYYVATFTAKGGVGKTTVAAHLAGAFALSGYKTTLVDGDLQGNLYRLMGDSVTVPSSRASKDNVIEVLKDEGQTEINKDSSVVVIDFSPALERNNKYLFKQINSFIVVTSINPLDIGNEAEVLIETIEQIQEKNEDSSIFILLNKYGKLKYSEEYRLKKVKGIISDKSYSKVKFILPEEVNIRDSRLLKNWGQNPDLAFKTTAGRCYPREDFLSLAEYLLQHLDIKQP